MPDIHDIYLLEAIKKINLYDLISFDIFDTLLFRICNEPSDVFTLAANKVIADYNFPYHIQDEKNLSVSE